MAPPLAHAAGKGAPTRRRRRWLLAGAVLTALAILGGIEGPRIVDRSIQAARHRHAIDASALPPAIADLPVVIARPRGSPKALVLFLSGDGGWQIIDRKITGPLARAGYLMAGLDSVAYFDQRRTPEGLAADMVRVLRTLQPDPRTPLALMGYSFGADVLPFIATRLPPDLKVALMQTVLLGPSPRADFWLDLGTLLRWTGIAEQPTEPEIAAMGSLPITCIYGEGEPASLCRSLHAPNLAVAHLPGDHHFDENYPLMIDTLRDILARSLP